LIRTVRSARRPAWRRILDRQASDGTIMTQLRGRRRGPSRRPCRFDEHCSPHRQGRSIQRAKAQEQSVVSPARVTVGAEQREVESLHAPCGRARTACIPRTPSSALPWSRRARPASRGDARIRRRCDAKYPLPRTGHRHLIERRRNPSAPCGRWRAATSVRDERNRAQRQGIDLFSVPGRRRGWRHRAIRGASGVPYGIACRPRRSSAGTATSSSAIPPLEAEACTCGADSRA
jgi:hypothetical protein